ncbi:replicative DNA helicase [Robbsia andropogonis]|uniref:replicative DNA helicase n=1 Tax=Robbsia andropogonis TaxID=28092 RepID=UPI000463A4C3|nr:replicative DNA helicase [Robbsia andropogonis]
MSHDDIRNAIPQSIEAEQYVLGALMLNNDAVDRVGALKAEHFFRGYHRAIYSEITALLGAGVGADVLTVFERLHAKGQAQDCGGLPYLNSLATSAPGIGNVARYAAIVIDRWTKRAFLATASEMQEDATNSPDSAAALLDRASAKLEGLARTQERKEAVKLSAALAEHLSVIERRSEGKERVISTGLVDLDRALNGGFRPGQSIVLAGRPGMGKTSLALNIGLSVSESGQCLFLSQEMPTAEIVDRATAQLGRIPLSKVMNAPLDDQDFWRSVTVAAHKVTDLGLFIDDQGCLTLLDVRNKARAIKRKHGLNLLVVDYLQLMSGDGSNRNEQIGAISRGIKALAKELDIAVLLLSQLNRKVEDRSSHIPQPSDLRDSGSIEQDADVILFIHREEVANPDCGDEWRGFALARIAKNRHGKTQDVGLNYAGEWTAFQDRIGAWPSHPAAPTRSRSRGFEG